MCMIGEYKNVSCNKELTGLLQECIRALDLLQGVLQLRLHGLQ